MLVAEYIFLNKSIIFYYCQTIDCRVKILIYNFHKYIVYIMINVCMYGVLCLSISATAVSTAPTTAPTTAETYLDIGIGVETRPRVHTGPGADTYYAVPPEYVLPAPGYRVRQERV